MIATILWYSLADKGTRTTEQAPAKTTPKTPTKTPTKGLIIRTKEIIQDVDSIGRQYCVDTNQGGLRVPCPGVVEVPEKKERVRNNRVYEMIAALGELHTGNPSDRKVDSVFNRLDKLNVAELQKVVDFYAGRPGATLPPKDVKDQLTEAVTKKRTKPYTAKIPDPTPDEPPIPLQDPGKPPPPEAEETPQPPPPPEPEAETPPEAPKPPKEKKPRTRKPKATKAPTTKADRTGSPRNKTEAIHDIVDIVTRGEQSTSPAPVTSSETSSTESDTEKTPNTSQEGVSISEPFEDEGDFTGEGGESEVAQPETTKPEAPKQSTPPPDNSNLPLPDEFQHLEGESSGEQSQTPTKKPVSKGQQIRDMLKGMSTAEDELLDIDLINSREIQIRDAIPKGKIPPKEVLAELTSLEQDRKLALRAMVEKNKRAHQTLFESLKGDSKMSLEASTGSKRVDVSINSGLDFVNKVFTGAPTSPKYKVNKGYDSRPGYSNGKIFMPHMTNPENSVHEIGHFLEDNVPGVLDATREFASRRFGDEKPQRLVDVYPDAGYDAIEMGRKDNFDKLLPTTAYYLGKEYPDGTEILSIGLEYLYRDPVYFAQKDPDYFDFIVGILDGSGRKKKST